MGIHVVLCMCILQVYDILCKAGLNGSGKQTFQVLDENGLIEWSKLSNILPGKSPYLHFLMFSFFPILVDCTEE